MRLATMLRKQRILMEKTTREMAAEMGLTLSTYSRIERGEDMNGQALAKVLIWLLSEERRNPQ